MKISLAIMDAAFRCLDGSASELDKRAVSMYQEANLALQQAKKDRAKAMRKKDQDAIMAADKSIWEAEEEMENAAKMLE